MKIKTVLSARQCGKTKQIMNDTLNGIIEEINRMRHYDWTQKEREENVHVMQRAKELNRESLFSVSPDNWQSRMLIAGQQGIIEHYLELCESPIDTEVKGGGGYF